MPRLPVVTEVRRAHLHDLQAGPRWKLKIRWATAPQFGGLRQVKQRVIDRARAEDLGSITRGGTITAGGPAPRQSRFADFAGGTAR